MTDWDSLPEQRRTERKEATELELAKDVAPPLDPKRKIDLNSAPRDMIMRLPGIGETIANRIIEGRPYQSVDSVTEVNGIGTKKLQRIRPFLKLSE
ncbi:helix-hairpin-helix domain-containing protein [Mariniblastus sp.]|nr:helix-hairpin-helix domain-containing protein [Mariniblastus sp.]